MKSKEIYCSVKMLKKAFKYTDPKEEKMLLEAINKEINKLTDKHQGLNDSARYWKKKLLD